MIPLTRKELCAELKKLGINASPELKSYLKEYYLYYVQPEINTYSPEKLTAGIKDSEPNEGTSVNQFSPIDPLK
jgi:hypothetical protein